MQLLLIILTLCQFSLDPQPVWDLASPTDQKGGDPVSDSSSVVASQPATSPSDDGAADEVFSHPGYYVVMYTASWCGPCRNWKAAGNVERMKALGYPLTIVDIDENPQHRGSVPRFEIVERGTGKRVWKITGGVSPETIISNIPSKPAGPLTAAGKSSVTHTSAGLDTQPVRMRQRLPVVNTQWGTIDLETYQRNCNCPMCQGIRQLQQQYRNSVPLMEQSNLPPGQQPTPDLILQDVVDELKLTQDDVLADFGCGDGRVLIAAVKQYGCKAVGVEIDQNRAATARENVKAAGLENSVTIITGDALEFDQERHGVTAAVAYLYPELLEKLQPKLKRIPVVVTPFHQVPGMEMTRRGELWVSRI